MSNIECYKIAFYIELKNSTKTLKEANLDIGNPGVGGTQYLFLLTVKKLNEKYGNETALLLTDGSFGIEENAVPYKIVESGQAAIRYCESVGIEVMVFNANILEGIKENELKTSIRIVLWAHNTLTWKRQCIAAKTDSISKVICVSRKQYENMKDTPCWNKCTYINNIIPDEFYNRATQSNHSKEEAVYIGSVMPQKGVHNLLEIWKYVEVKAPNAQLYIYGGANVWNPSAKLGGEGVADIYYDRVIQRRLNRLEHPENIHFMGAKGWRDIDGLISSSRVGIVNPSFYRRDETFCMSAVEMEAHGIPVISRQREDGINTTIKHGETGFLEKDNKEMASRIVALLQNRNLSVRMGEKARIFSVRFRPENEIYKWMEIVEEHKLANKCSKVQKKSKDAKLLEHDFLLKIAFLVESGKAIDLVIRKMKGK